MREEPPVGLGEERADISIQTKKVGEINGI